MRNASYSSSIAKVMGQYVLLVGTHGRGAPMKLLIKNGSNLGLVAHLPDVHGVPLCLVKLKLAD